MGAISERSSTSLGLSTLGRLGGLSSCEAERGERALWLSGGGYRAALFHLGALTRLNELGLLARIGTVGAVAGGSIPAALLATQIPWPLHGAYRDWPERLAKPMRQIASSSMRTRSIFRRPFPGAAVEAAQEERYARKLVTALGGESRWAPRFVFGASGLTLSGLVAGWEECIEWEIGSSPPTGYSQAMVEEAIATMPGDLDALGEAEQAVLENHGYLLADAALRDLGLTIAGGIEGLPPEPPHPRWMNEEHARETVLARSRGVAVKRLRPRRSRRDQGKAKLGKEGAVALLNRYRPVLRYDSLESFRAESVEGICSLALPGRCNSLHREDGTTIASATPGEGEARLDLAFLGSPTYGDGTAAERDDYLDQCGGFAAADALRMQRSGGSEVIYGRARRDDSGYLWLQYWLFFYCHDKGLLGIEQHEGDWQMVQMKIGEDGNPEVATFARHSGADSLSWDQLELAPSAEGPVPVVYLARGSHAPLPRSGSYEAPVLPDHNDALGPQERPELAVIADDGPGWVHWPGRWGSTRRREYFEGESPRGPREHPGWWTPAKLHREARPWDGTASAIPAPKSAAPTPVRIGARQEGGLAIVDYHFPAPAQGQREPARIVAAPIDADGQVGPARPFPLEGRTGSLVIQLPETGDWRGVRACVTSERGVAGPTLNASLSA
jgi:hypothetical protein